MTGIKEVAEIGAFVRVLVKFVAERAKDGVGVDDLIALVTKALTDDAFVAQANAAITDAEKAIAELADLDRNEAKFVLGLGADIVYDIIEAVKK